MYLLTIKNSHVINMKCDKFTDFKLTSFASIFILVNNSRIISEANYSRC